MSKFDWKVCDRTGIIHKVLICSEIEFSGGFNASEGMEYTQYRFGLSGSVLYSSRKLNIYLDILDSKKSLMSKYTYFGLLLLVFPSQSMNVESRIRNAS